jgi:hypothetical protein
MSSRVTLRPNTRLYHCAFIALLLLHGLTFWCSASMVDARGSSTFSRRAHHRSSWRRRCSKTLPRCCCSYTARGQLTTTKAQDGVQEGRGGRQAVEVPGPPSRGPESAWARLLPGDLPPSQRNRSRRAPSPHPCGERGSGPDVGGRRAHGLLSLPLKASARPVCPGRSRAQPTPQPRRARPNVPSLRALGSSNRKPRLHAASFIVLLNCMRCRYIPGASGSRIKYRSELSCRIVPGGLLGMA